MSIHILSKEHGIPAGTLLGSFSESFDNKKQRRHELWILSCYVDFNLIENYADYLLQKIRLTDIRLAFNFAEIYTIGPKQTFRKLDSITDRLRAKGINFEWRALASSKLVHSKGYALIQKAGGDLSGGVVLTTSANFTVPGFNGGNIELGHLSKTRKDIEEFKTAYDYLWKEVGSDTDTAILKQENYLLKFALLSSGLFLHKWSGNLSQVLGIKYELTPHAKKRATIAPELAAVGFQTGDTFTRQVINSEKIPKKEIPQQFITRFTIETYWGRWCPIEAWRALGTSSTGEAKFIKKFRQITDKRVIVRLKTEALKVQEELIKQRLIEKVDHDHLEKWAIRIEELGSDEGRLQRFYRGYEAHKLPYSIEQKPEIEDLFDNLKLAITKSKAKNTAKHIFLLAMSEADPEILQLTPDELNIIKAYEKNH